LLKTKKLKLIFYREGTPLECLATFDTTHMALRFEKVCRQAGLAVKIVPVPRELSASCGLACRYPCEAGESVTSLVKEHHIDILEYHRLGDEEK